MNHLSKMKPVNLRTGWAHEAGSFTPWLADSENLSLLADTLGLRLELEGTEVNVGPFRADILCRDVEQDHRVLIENQLERTDHTHLGQILTYVAGLEVKTVIWIAADFTEEHRAALDWLNAATHEGYHFFGVQVELWRIGDSLPAPRFNLVAKPNDWSRQVAKAARTVVSGELSELGQKRLAYWTAFKAYLETHYPECHLRRPFAGSTIFFSTKYAGITVRLYRAQDEIGVFLRVDGPTADDLYGQLSAHQAALQSHFSTALLWQKPSAGAYWIVHSQKANVNDEVDWSSQFAFFVRSMQAFTLALESVRWTDEPSDGSPEAGEMA